MISRRSFFKDGIAAALLATPFVSNIAKAQDNKNKFLDFLELTAKTLDEARIDANQIPKPRELAIKIALRKTITLNWFLGLDNYCKQKLLEPKSEDTNNVKLLKEKCMLVYNHLRRYYLYRIRIRSKIDELYNSGKLQERNNEFLARFDPTKIGEIITSSTIHLMKIDENFTRLLINKCSVSNCPTRIVFIIAIIENSYGKNLTSNMGAKGPLQIIDKTALEIERMYGITPPLNQLSEDKAYERRIEDAILYINHLIDFYDLKIIDNNIEIIDFIALMMFYNKGDRKIIEEFDKWVLKENSEAFNYASLALTALSYRLSVD